MHGKRWDFRKKKINSSGKKHAHKIQSPETLWNKERKKWESSQAAVYRRYINKMKEKTKKMREELGAPSYILPSPSRKLVKKMKKQGHTSVPMVVVTRKL